MSISNYNVNVTGTSQYDATIIEVLADDIVLYDLTQARTGSPSPRTYTAYLPQGLEIGQTVRLTAGRISDTATDIVVFGVAFYEPVFGASGNQVTFYQNNNHPIEFVWRGFSWEVRNDNTRSSTLLGIGGTIENPNA